MVLSDKTIVVVPRCVFVTLRVKCHLPWQYHVIISPQFYMYYSNIVFDMYHASSSVCVCVCIVNYGITMMHIILVCHDTYLITIVIPCFCIVFICPATLNS